MGLLKFITESREARKIFGEKEIKIVEKQMLGVNLTQSEKNRLSRDIRAKLEFIAKAAKFESEFDLKKGAEIKKIAEEAKEDILKDALAGRIKSIILFGSAVENKLTLQSDIDIAVKFGNASVAESTLFRKKLLGKVNKKVDLQVYNALPETIKREIDQKGRMLYSNEQDKGKNRGN